MNRKRLNLYVLPVLVFFTSLWVCPRTVAAQNAQDRNQGIQEEKIISWESPARLHEAIGTEKGNLKISGEGLEFQSTKGRSVRWTFVEVQTFFLAPHRLDFETYQNRKHHLPGMQRFKFDLDQAIPPELANDLSRKIRRPSQNAVPDPASQGIVILAHHRTLTGGTNGTLRFTNIVIAYVSDVRGDSRSWRWADLQTVSDPDPWHLLVFGYRDTYNFDLKEPLPQLLFYRLVDAVDAQNAVEQRQRAALPVPTSVEKHGQGGRDE